jgi:sugar/nucleoside kinase (ribokinase family)
VPDLALADPTGAGDGFNGGCLVGLARGEGTRDAAVTGCVAASFVIQAIGIAVPDTFSNQARLERYRQCVGTEAAAIERDELV